MARPARLRRAWLARGVLVSVRSVIVAACLLLSLHPGSLRAAPGAKAVEGKRLVGEWVGHWASSAGSSDSLFIAVETVQDDRVSGTLFMAVATPGQGYYNRDVPFSGVFDGAELTIWVPPALWFSLKVSGDRMQGVVRGQQTFGTVDLQKKR
jgi:hypothetical protein